MDKILNLINELEQSYPDWKELFEEDNIKRKLLNDAFNDDKKAKVEELIKTILDYQKTLDDKKEKELWAKLYELPDNVKTKIQQINQRNIFIYRSASKFSASDKLPLLIKDVFENLTVYYNPDFFKSGSNYGIESLEDFDRGVLWIDYIITNDVRKHISKEFAANHFAQLTGFDDSCKEIYEQLYEKYYNQIQINILLEQRNTQGR